MLAAEPESKTESLKMQRWFLGHAVPWEAVWLPVASTKALWQAENTHRRRPRHQQMTS